MFVRMSRAWRLRAGWIVALAYLFCVLAPSLSFALPGGQAAPHCLTSGERVHAQAGLHHDHASMAAHVDDDGQDRDPTNAQARVHRIHDPAIVDHVVDHDAGAVAADDGLVPSKAPHAVDGKCCGVMCATALPAADVTVARPSGPKAVRVSETDRELADRALAGLYRPPIS